VLRILRAFAWLRWRVLLNSLERTGSRDLVERFSLGIEQLSPIVMAVVMIPTALALAGAAALAGWTAARGDTTGGPLGLVRVVLLIAVVFALVGPLLLPSGGRPGAVRLLLLPIPRGVLYVAQTLSTLADPWILLVTTIVIVFPAGLAAGGAAAGAVVAVAGGLLFIGVLLGLSAVTSSLLQLAVRNRRRGELLAVLGMLLLSAVGLVPLAMDRGRTDRAPDAVGRGETGAGPWWAGAAAAAQTALPSESYVRSVTGTLQRDHAVAARGLAAVAGTAAVLHALAFVLFGRLLASPGSVGSGPTRVRSTSRAAARLPGVSPAVSAVALNQVRLAFRTPRGRSTLFSPIVIFLVFAALAARSGSGVRIGEVAVAGGLSFAAMAAVVSLLAILPLAMNQFAIDRAGLTLMLLAPVSTGAILAGKALGNGVVAAIPAALCTLIAYVLFPSGHPGLWMALPLAATATYLLMAPCAAALSAVFPRPVDLNSIGSGSNAHGAAALLGMLSIVFGGTPAVLLVLLAAVVLDRPALAPVLLLGWCAIAAIVCVLAFQPVARLFDGRRETLALRR
jgi:hypothetical protein